ncbi:MAG: class I mannose-6-phosphate isomerase [Pirellulales bacterium]|nr:class I mannose-6-phosphate isomerase [Pirellulales bacterium]
MPRLTPLRMQPILRRYVWGGTRLGSLLDKPVGDDPYCAESWEICDRGPDQTIVSHGPLAGMTLHQLVQEHGEELLGRHHPQPAFPLLFKFLDTAAPLSVQVHPDDALAAQARTPDLGKTEAWYILDAEPESVIYAGLSPGVDQGTFEEELRSGLCETCLHSFEPRAGDCVFVPAGAVHALGAGLLVAEIQQASDTTYRLFDWNRLGTDGKPRPLHVEEGLRAIHFRLGPIGPVIGSPTVHDEATRLVACDKFVWDRWTIDEAITLGGDHRCHLLAVVEGELHVAGDPARRPLRRGETMLLPAACGATALRPHGNASVLDAYLP